MAKRHPVLVVLDSNRVTCGRCEYLHTVVTGGSEDEWGCDLFGEAHLGLKSHMKTPNRARVCTDAEKAATSTRPHSKSICNTTYT